MNIYFYPTFILLLSFNLMSGQHYVIINNYIGVETNPFLSHQEEISDSIINLFPSPYSDSILIFSSHNYLHNSKFTNDLSESINLVVDSIESISKYYIAIINFSNEANMCEHSIVKILLPPSALLNPCFKPDIINSIETTITNNFNKYTKYTIDSYFAMEYDMLKLVYNKFNHLLNCCNLQRTPEECQECSIQIDDAISLLENNNYCNIKLALESLLEMPLSINVFEKQYSSIQSNYNLIFYNDSANFSYSYTDKLEIYRLSYTDTNEYNIILNYFDNNFSTEDIPCFENIEEPIRASNSFNNFDDIYVLSDQDDTYVMAKTIFFDPLIKEQVILYNNSEESNEFVEPIMISGYNDAKNIYLKNGFDILELSIFESENEYNNLEINERSIFYNFIKHSAQFVCPYGRTAFPDPYSLFISKTEDCSYGCFINYGRFQWEKQSSTSIGYVLAHEILHNMTVKGSLLLDLPITAPNLAYFFDGGHFNWEDNLLKAGPLVNQIPIPKENYLHPNEIINKEAIYFMLKYLYSNVGR